MSHAFDPFYDPSLTYDENFKKGPFGSFGDDDSDELNIGTEFTFLGHKLKLPLGIPAGPLLNGAYVKAAFRRGFCLPMYKTVRSKEHSVNGFPNVVPVQVEGEKLTLEHAAEGMTMGDDFVEPIAITNSFGVPSMSPEWWQADMKESVEAAGEGQVMIASFQGTNRGEGVEAFIEDHVFTAKLVKETGAKIMEMNLSCPNEGKAKLLCHDTEMVKIIAERVKAEIGDTPLLLKMSYFEDDAVLKDFIEKLSPIVQGFSVINTIAGKVNDKDGNPALGEARPVSGVCGAPIKWAGVEMVSRMSKMRKEMGADFVLLGSGGVTTPADYKEYIDAGADVVMVATGAMWNPNLAKEIAESL